MNLTTLSHQLNIARYEANEDASPLDLTAEGNFDNMPSASGTTFLGAFDINKGLTSDMKPNAICFSFTGGTAAGKTFTWKLFAWRPSNGFAKQVAQGTGTLGTQAVVTYPHNGETATDKFWADTLTVSWYNWFKRVRSTATTGRNSVAEIWFDACGWPWWYMEIADAAGGPGSEASNVASYYGYF
jgi:hypothetical protein